MLSVVQRCWPITELLWIQHAITVESMLSSECAPVTTLRHWKIVEIDSYEAGDTLITSALFNVQSKYEGAGVW